MRATIIFVVFLGVFCALSSALPMDQEEPVELDIVGQAGLVGQQGEEAPVRHKRATCDLLSIFNVNDSACALHCIGHSYRGGYCNSQKVCVCRR